MKSQLPPTLALMLAALLGVACGPSGGGTSSLSGGGTGGEAEVDVEGGGDVGVSADSTTGPPFPPGEAICIPDAAECSVAADCCSGPQPDPAFNDDKHTCPSSTYPNNWSCEFDSGLGFNVCVNAGCTSNNDCGQNAGFAAMICRVIEQNGPGYCVRYCDDDDGCDPDNLFMRCTGVAYEGNTKYCEQDPAP